MYIQWTWETHTLTQYPHIHVHLCRSFRYLLWFIFIGLLFVLGGSSERFVFNSKRNGSNEWKLPLGNILWRMETRIGVCHIDSQSCQSKCKGKTYPLLAFCTNTSVAFSFAATIHSNKDLNTYSRTHPHAYVFIYTDILFINHV